VQRNVQNYSVPVLVANQFLGPRAHCPLPQTMRRPGAQKGFSSNHPGRPHDRLLRGFFSSPASWFLTPPPDCSYVSLGLIKEACSVIGIRIVRTVPSPGIPVIAKLPPIRLARSRIPIRPSARDAM